MQDVAKQVGMNSGGGPSRGRRSDVGVVSVYGQNFVQVLSEWPGQALRVVCKWRRGMMGV